MKRIEAIKSKSDAIKELKLERLECAKQVLVILKKKKSKYPKVNLNRMFKVLGWIIKAAEIQNQINLIKAQPIEPSEGLAIVGEAKLNLKK